jgi:hypothetical protein
LSGINIVGIYRILSSLGERLLSLQYLAATSAKTTWIVFFLPHLLVEVSMLLEPISIHSLPFHFHEVVDGVQLSLADEVGLILTHVLSEPLLVIEEDRLVIRPKMLHLLLLV